jgi:predicted AlkP superfamily phosphohydrolase/phosphomutase
MSCTARIAYDAPRRHRVHTKQRLLAIGLDGFEISLAERMMAEGSLPHMAALRARSAAFDLDHGKAKYSGLAWEHVSTGRAPADGGRFSAVTFDPATYSVCQEPTAARPVFADLAARTVVFDAPYFDLAQADAVLGLTNWGAHDPGVSAQDRPAGLMREAIDRFGPYGAKQWIYGFCWPSPARTREAGAALAAAVRQRADVAVWLLRDRIPEWDLALLTVAESHSASEPLWHGIDPANPVHCVPSATDAREAMRAIYVEIDALIGRLAAALPDARILVFAMHGMGTNDADVAAMALLPELMFRLAFGRPHFAPRSWAGTLPNGAPLLADHENWREVMREIVVRPQAPAEAKGWLARLARLGSRDPGPIGVVAPPSDLDWMPAARYQPFWSRMPAFALPAFYDGQIRINLAGREAAGSVAPEAFAATRARWIETLMATRNALTGEPAVEAVWSSEGDPLARRGDEPDLHVTWRSAPLGLVHPRAGTIGPLPMRRTGGHTGDRGFVWIETGRGAAQGWRSAFDVVPTIFSLLGEAVPPGISGRPIEVSGGG